MYLSILMMIKITHWNYRLSTNNVDENIKHAEHQSDQKYLNLQFFPFFIYRHSFIKTLPFIM